MKSTSEDDMQTIARIPSGAQRPATTDRARLEWLDMLGQLEDSALYLRRHGLVTEARAVERARAILSGEERAA